MSNLLDKFFRSEKIMLASYVLILLGFIYQFARNLIVNNTIYPLNLTLYITGILFSSVVYFTYRSHDKDIMKPALGMLMGVVVTYSLNVFSENVLDSEILADYLTSGVSGYISLVLDFLQFALFFEICIVHLALNKNHSSSPKLLMFNKVVTLGLFLDYLLQIVFAFLAFRSAERGIYYLMFYLTLTAITVLIVCIESKIDFFREQREKKS